MKAHRTDGVSLVFALIFLALAGWWLLAQIMDLALPAVGWFLAGALILVGVLGLLGALRSGRSAPPAAGAAAVVEPPGEMDATAVLPESAAPVPGDEPGGEQPYGAADEPPTRELRYLDHGDRPAADPDRDQRERPGQG